jgi:hypothetical protein
VGFNMPTVRMIEFNLFTGAVVCGAPTVLAMGLDAPTAVVVGVIAPTGLVVGASTPTGFNVGLDHSHRFRRRFLLFRNFIG